MTKLTDTQRAILTAACQRPNRSILPLREHLKGGAAHKVVGALIARGLVEEVEAGRDDPVWRATGDGRGATLVATDAALDALGIEVDCGPTGADSATASTASGDEPARDGECASGADSGPCEQVARRNQACAADRH